MINAQSNQNGFTILELMIATTVFSVLLVMVSVVMISIGGLYFKGINQSRVQGSVRAIIDEVSRHLELSKYAPQTGHSIYGGIDVYAYCIGDTRYSYVIGHQIGDGVQHVLWRDAIDPNTCPTPPNLVNGNVTDGVELIAPNSRLTMFPGPTVDTISPYDLTVGVAYGETDLLTAPSGPGVRCTNNSSRQFCASAYLDTLVLQRITPE